jgi:acyl-CoA synthetase (AMP-forming)/AMP-acid ligase II
MALVVFQSGMSATKEGILEHCRNNLAAFKCPKSVEILESLPKGGTGKILKRRLRERFWAAHSRRVNG